MTKRLLLPLLMAVVALSGCGKPKLEGVWQGVEAKWTGPTPGTNSNPQPGFYIFTKNHYSTVAVIGDKPRPQAQDVEKATADELRAMWGPFVANAGTYEISGDTLTTRPLVAKNPKVMSPGSSATASFKLEGDTLTLALHFPPSNPIITLKRIE
jgi:hypothetical protein